MPQLTLRGIGTEAAASASTELLDELAAICDCGPDMFTMDCLHVTSLFGGRAADTFPFVEVAWFDRGKAVQDQVAEAIARHLRAVGVAELEIAFKTYASDSYYIDGRPWE